jgi:ubiquinone/menaquinone biosynthesis C-methylase UbiE
VVQSPKQEAGAPLSENTDLYTGVVAWTYDLLIPAGEIDDEDFYRQAISESGEPALEIGCGTGRLLLRYVEDGFDVEGVDPSAAMLGICRRKAGEKGLEPSLHRQTMESLELPRKFRTIYIPVSSFMLVTDKHDVERALDRFLQHLEPGGKVLIPLHDPLKSDYGIGPAPEDEWRLRREGTRPSDGATVRCWERVTYDLANQIRSSVLRYEIVRSGEAAETDERSTALRWYTQEQFRELLDKAGFSNVRAVRGQTNEPAGADDAEFTFIAER